MGGEGVARGRVRPARQQAPQSLGRCLGDTRMLYAGIPNSRALGRGAAGDRVSKWGDNPDSTGGWELTGDKAQRRLLETRQKGG